MSTKAHQVISTAATFYLNATVARLIFKIRRASQEYRLKPDCGLHNLWEEIFVQQQSERWYGYHLVEQYLEAQISLLVYQLPQHVKLILSYESVCDIDADLINEQVLSNLYSEANSFNNKRISIYHDR